MAAPGVVATTGGTGSGTRSGGSTGTPSLHPPAGGSGVDTSGSETSGSSPFGAGSGSGVAAGSPVGSGSTFVSSGSSGGAPTSGTIAQPSGSSGSGSTSGAGFPCLVQQLLVNRCQSCHGVVPIEPAPNSLVTVADLTSPSLVNQAWTNAQESVSRMQNTVFPMPTPPAAPATQDEIAALQAWIAAKYPLGGGCAPDAGTGDTDPDASTGPTYNGPLICSSGKAGTGGNGPAMRPGDACSTCHGFSIAGTAYKTEHESEGCAGANVTGATVVITDATGFVETIPVGTDGNFYTTDGITGPFRAKILYQGRERDMLSPQAFGSCNFCHTSNGANTAPGRIMLP